MKEEQKIKQDKKLLFEQLTKAKEIVTSMLWALDRDKTFPTKFDINEAWRIKRYGEAIEKTIKRLPLFS